MKKTVKKIDRHGHEETWEWEETPELKEFIKQQARINLSAPPTRPTQYIMELDITDEEPKVSGVIERVDPFYLPIFQYKDVISDEQSEALKLFCEAQEYNSTSLRFDEKEDNLTTSVSDDRNVLLKIPDMKEYFEALIQDISFQIMKQNSQGFDIKSSWCTKTTNGQSSLMHMHKNYYMSAILYLQEDNQLIVENPCWDMQHYLFPLYKISPYTCNSTMIVTPKNSLLIMPAWMKHQIPKYDKSDVRYSIVMNVHPINEYGVDTSQITVKQNMKR